MKRFFRVAVLLLVVTNLPAQKNDTIPVSNFFHPQPPSYTVKQAFEIEFRAPVYFSGGYHASIGFRSNKFRIRLSLKNGGTDNVEDDGFHNASADFDRFYSTSPGVFFGYNVWRHFELYTFLELHNYEIVRIATGEKKSVFSKDYGMAISYQFFIGKYFYILPGLQLYLRTDKRVDFSDSQYNIPNADISPVLSVGARLWRKY